MDKVNENQVFVKLNEYKDALKLFEELKTKIAMARETLQKIESLRIEEKTEIELWQRSLSEIESRVVNIDELLEGHS